MNGENELKLSEKIKDFISEYIWLVVVIIVLFFIVRSCYFDDKSKKILITKQKTVENNIKNMADSIAITTNANNTWLAELCGKDSVRWENILTIEIEKLWLSNKPILFVGFISDIKSTGTDYEIYINHDALFENFFTIEDFQLVLKSSKKQINELLNDKLQLIENQFIAIAKITKIENRKYLDFEGYEESDFIGFGELVKIVPIDVEKFREWGEKHNKQEKDSLYWEQYKIETTRPIIMNRDSFENDSLYWEQFKVE